MQGTSSICINFTHNAPHVPNQAANQPVRLHNLFRDVLGRLLIFLEYKNMNALSHVNHWLHRNIIQANLLPPLYPGALKQQMEARPLKTPVTYVEYDRLIKTYAHFTMPLYFPYIHYLDISSHVYSVLLDDAGLQKIINQFPNLLSLSIASNKITNAGLECLKSITLLRRLNFMGCKQIGDAGLAHLSGLTRLENLNLSACQITDAGLQHLSAFKHLRCFNLALCKQITGVGLAYLKGCTDLYCLDLTWCEAITDEGLACFSAFTSLQCLELSYCRKITDIGLQSLQGLRLLEFLYLTWCTNLTGQGLHQLRSKLPKLKVDVHGCVKIMTYRA